MDALHFNESLHPLLILIPIGRGSRQSGHATTEPAQPRRAP